MTVKELYDWVKKNNCENYKVTFIDNPEQGTFVEPILDNTEMYEDEVYFGTDAYCHNDNIIVLHT